MKTKGFDGSSFLESGKTPTDKDWIDWLERGYTTSIRMSKIKKIIKIINNKDEE